MSEKHAIVIETHELVCGYAKVAAVRGLTMSVAEGEIVCLLGANGAGKSTTLLTIAGVLPPIGGTLRVLGEPVRHAEPDKIGRRGLTLVPAGRGLFYRLTVAENLRLRRHRRSSVTVEQILENFPILKPILKRKAGLLSGGEQQIVAIAGALLSDPRVIMLDEMSLGLAPKIVDDLLPIVRSIASDRGIGVLLVEQHIGIALQIADRGYVMTRGRITAEGSALELKDQAADLEASYLGRQAG